MNAKLERSFMDLPKSMAARFCRIPPFSARRSRSPGPCMIANRAHTRAFPAILRDVRKLRDWSVEGPDSGELLSEFSNPNDDRCQSVDAVAVVDGEAN
jgi:hypothetical protein